MNFLRLVIVLVALLELPAQAQYTGQWSALPVMPEVIRPPHVWVHLRTLSVRLLVWRLDHIETIELPIGKLSNEVITSGEGDVLFGARRMDAAR